MLNLEELNFKVITGELDEALKKIDALTPALERLGNAQAKEAKAAAQVTKATAESSETTKTQTNLLQKHKDILDFMTQGYSRGQSGQLAMAKSSGLLTSEIEELGKVLKIQRTLMGTDPFDKSIGAMQRLSNEYTVLKDVQRQYLQGSYLTQSQAQDLAREKLRLIEAGKIEGKTFSEIKAEVYALSAAYQHNAEVSNEIASSIKTKKAAIDALRNAEQDMITTENKLAAQNELVARGFTVSSANAIIKYKELLTAAGVSANEFKQKLYQMEQALMQKQGTSPFAKMQQDVKKTREEVDHLSRAIGVQLGDVGVSLASGQNPLTVLIQQGDQLRFAVANAKDAGQDLEKAMSNAVRGIATSFIDTGKVIGGFFINSIKQTGDYLTKASMESVGLTKYYRLLRLELYKTAEAGTEFDKQLYNFTKNGVPALIGGIAALSLAFGVTLVAAIISATKEQDALVRSTNSMGAYFGASAEEAYKLTQSLDGISSSKASEVLQKMISDGKFTKESFQAIAAAAVNMEKYAGISIDKTVEQFNKLKDDPVKALTEVAKQTGYVGIETIRTVSELEKMGMRMQAVEVASDAMANAMNKSALDIRKELSLLSVAWIDVKDAASLFWDDLKNSSGVNAIIEGLAFLVRSLAAGFTLAAMGAESMMVALTSNRSEIAANLEAVRTKYSNILDKIQGNVNATDSLTAAQKRYNAELAVSYSKQAGFAERLNKELNQPNAKSQSLQAFLQSKQNEFMQGGEIQTLEQLNQMVKLRTKWVKEYNEANKQTNTELNKQESYLSRIRERVSDMNIATQDDLVVRNQLTKAAKLYQDIITDPEYAKITDKKIKADLQEQLILLENLDAQQQMIELRKVQKKFDEDYLKFQQQNADIITSNRTNIDSEISKLELREQILGKTDEEVKRITQAYEQQAKIQAIKVKYAEQELKIQRAYDDLADKPGTNVEKLTQQFESDTAALYEQMQQEIANVFREGAIAGLEDIDAAYKKLRQGLSDAIYEALVNGGEAGIKSLGKLIESEINRKIKLQIEASISGAGATGGSVGTLINTATDIYSAYKTGNFTGSVDKVISGLDDLAFSLASSGNGGIASTISSVSGTISQYSSTISSALPYASSVVDILKGDYGSGIGGALGTWAGSAAGAAIGGTLGSIVPVLGTAIGSAIGSALFGGKKPPKDIYLTSRTGASQYEDNVSSTGAFGTIGLDVAAKRVNANDYKSAFDAIVQLDNFIASNLSESEINNVRSVLTRMDSYNKESAVDFTARRLRVITDAIGGAIGSLAAQFKGTSQQFIDYVSKLVSVNKLVTTLSDLGIQFNSNRESALKFMVSLQDLVGGQENLTSAFVNYYNNFYSAQEKLNIVTNQLTESFAEIGKQLPQTKDEFKAMVDQAILLSDADLTAALLGLQGGVLNMFSLADEANSSAIDTLDDLKDAWKRLTDSIFEEVGRIRGLIAVDSGKGLQYYQQQFTTNTQLALSGDQEAAATLTDLSRTIIDIAKTTSSSYEEYVTLQARIAASLEATGTALANQYGLDIPQFASGGSYSGGLALVGEQGPELINFSSSGTVHTAAQTSSLLNNDDMVALLVKLNDRVDMLEAAARSTAVTNNKIAKLLDRVAPEGDALQTRVVT